MGRLARDHDVLRLLLQKNSRVTRMKVPTTAPTPIPALAPVDKALLCTLVGMGETAAVLLLGAKFVFDGWAVNEVGERVEDVVEKE